MTVADAAAPGATATTTALIVDDDPDLRELLRLRMERLGVSVATAGSGEAALDAVLASPPDVVFVDILLPGMDGWELVRRIRDETGAVGTAVIVTSVLDPPDDMPTIDAYLIKPFRSADVVGALARVLADRHTPSPQEGGD